MQQRLFTAALLAVSCATIAAAEPLPGFRLAAEGVYVGGEPAGEAAYNRLASLGVRTIVSVDGLPPDAASARARGIRVVHVPLGYDGVPADACAALKRVALECERPIYAHCHHGNHRGPAAAAILGIAAGLLDKLQAERLLIESGTDPEFAGLWRDVARYDASRYDTQGVVLREAMRVEPFVLAMAQLGRAWRPIEQRPTGEAVEVGLRVTADRKVFLEALRETSRHARGYDPTGEIARRLEELQREAGVPSGGFDALVIGSRCANCHSEWRD